MRILALVKRIILQMLRDKRALALMMVAPLLILTLLHYLLSGGSDTPRLGVNLSKDDALIEMLKDKDLEVLHYDGLKTSITFIEQHDLDGVLEAQEDTITLTLLNEETSKAKVLQMNVQQALAAINAKKQAENMKKFVEDIQTKLQVKPPQMEQVAAPSLHTTFIYGNKDTTFFDLLSPILVGFFVFFFVFLISGIALLKERTTGTLDRLMATPIKRWNIVFGYVFGYGLFAIIQTLIVVFYSVKVLDITIVGSLWNVILINLTLALVALSLGILLSSFANSEFQMMQFIPVAIVPQIFFAGILPVEGMANWLQVIAKFIPMYYGGNALVNIMYKGLGLSDIKNDIFVLLGFACVFLVLNILALKKYRKI
ncbi:ABC transporter permease [Lederbergia wuyishanensis]|uniref:ABC-2 type transport system permease protein n=1 Tax=Lederbergia wuyishanensis TaxID=1347903 RepID=A0ABU0D834_9BACI|nr:ABC transporter permease [Lederbergia wuyishanensis]MCJ8009283.1 ABC transporter permease [Lederbergia wuyishanensis]MDQ0344583.1 ABC-2 type transport system permease protein [Lederbergia wuyishanensis]